MSLECHLRIFDLKVCLMGLSDEQTRVNLKRHFGVIFFRCDVKMREFYSTLGFLPLGMTQPVVPGASLPSVTWGAKC